jgi:archaetidylinositol phosphate synthase
MVHIREHRSVLAAAEKALLIRIAGRLPGWINSDHLTLLAFASMIGAGVAFAGIGTTAWSAVVFVAALAANWFGDSLDGTVARVRNQQRPQYGYYVDHVVDLAGTAALFGGMAASGLMTPAIAMAMLAAYCLVAAESFLATHSVGIFRISFAGVGPTELRVLLAAGAIAVTLHPWVAVAGRQMLLFDAGGIVAIGGMIVAFTASAVRNTRTLYAREPMPSGGAEERAA